MLAALESAGIDCEQVLAINRGKVDEAFDVISLVESAVYDTDEWSRGGGNEDRVKEISTVFETMQPCAVLADKQSITSRTAIRNKIPV